MIGKALLAGLGGFLGSMLRYLVSGAIHRLAPASLFPYGTLVVNVSGCLGIGLLATLAEARGVFSGEQRVFLLIGVLGGYTTFSTLGYETYQLLRDGQDGLALSNALLHVIAGVGAVWTGSVLARVVS